MERLPTITSALAVVAALASGCGDETLAPSAEPIVPLAATSQEREQMRGELLFAGDQMSLALQHHPANNQVAAAFTAVALGVERNDRRSVEHALAAAQAAILQYQGIGGADQAADPDLEALTLTLDRVAALATPTKEQP